MNVPLYPSHIYIILLMSHEHSVFCVRDTTISLLISDAFVQLPQEDAEKLFNEADLNKDGMQLGSSFHGSFWIQLGETKKGQRHKTLQSRFPRLLMVVEIFFNTSELAPTPETPTSTPSPLQSKHARGWLQDIAGIHQMQHQLLVSYISAHIYIYNAHVYHCGTPGSLAKQLWNDLRSVFAIQVCLCMDQEIRGTHRFRLLLQWLDPRLDYAEFTQWLYTDSNKEFRDHVFHKRARLQRFTGMGWWRFLPMIQADSPMLTRVVFSLEAQSAIHPRKGASETRDKVEQLSHWMMIFAFKMAGNKCAVNRSIIISWYFMCID